MKKKVTTTLRGLAAPLLHALEELVASDIERRPFVIVEDRVTKKFVQFARRYNPKTGSLLFDVPSLRPPVVLKPCPDLATGMRWATDVLRDEFGLPDGAELTITIDGDPTN